MPNNLVPTSHCAQFGKAVGGDVGAPAVTIFALPKPFVGDAARIQHNSIASWAAVGQHVEVILMGDEHGIKEKALELNVTHVADIKRNEAGTPLVGDAFRVAEDVAQSEILIYCNADVILQSAFFDAVIELARDPLCRDSFLAIGTRVDVRGDDQRFDFSDRQATFEALKRLRHAGIKSSICCKEFFAYRKGSLGDVPDFAVGRGNWDNWMVASAKRRGVPVVRLADEVSVLHQEHGYQHLNAQGKRRLSCYVSGAEARRNEQLAGGKHLISGSTATHRMTSAGVVAYRWAALNFEFWRDLPRFAALVRGLYLPERRS